MDLKKIVVVGSLNMDLVVRVSRHPAAGETILGGEFHTFPGGKGANQAVASARLGAPVVMIGKVGQDTFGAELQKTITAEGIDTTYLGRDAQAASGVALITVSADGQNTIVVASGANANLSPSDVEQAAPAFVNAGVLVLQLETPLETVLRAVQLARTRGVTVILNPAPAQPLPDELLAQVDYLVPNRSELSLLAGGVQGLDEAVDKILPRLAGCLIVTLGEQGALVVENGERRHIPAFSIQPVDTTAAGDAFIGALAAALDEGLPLADAVRWGSAAGAISATRMGAQPSLPAREEVLKFLKEHKR